MHQVHLIFQNGAKKFCTSVQRGWVDLIESILLITTLEYKVLNSDHALIKQNSPAC